MSKCTTCIPIIISGERRYRRSKQRIETISRGNNPCTPLAITIRRNARSSSSLVMSARLGLKSFCFHSCCWSAVCAIRKLFILSRRRIHVLSRCGEEHADERARKLRRGTTFVTVACIVQFAQVMQPCRRPFCQISCRKWTDCACVPGRSAFCQIIDPALCPFRSDV